MLDWMLLCHRLWIMVFIFLFTSHASFELAHLRRITDEDFLWSHCGHGFLVLGCFLFISWKIKLVTKMDLSGKRCGYQMDGRGCNQ